jgi:hypothetical protein
MPSALVVTPLRDSDEEPGLPGPLGPGLRLYVLLRRGKLDRALARGEDPVASRALALRAGQLAGPRGRELVVAGLERAVHAAEQSSRRFVGAAVLPDAAAVRANRSAMLDLVDRLRSPEPVAAAGVARMLLLLRDGSSALYTAGAAQQLGRELDRAYRALSP